MKHLNLLLVFALCTTSVWASRNTLEWNITDTVLASKLVGPTKHGGVLDTVTISNIQYGLRFQHPGDGMGYKTAGTYFHSCSSAKGNNYVELHVPGGVKARLAITFSTGSGSQSYNFFYNKADATEKAPSVLYDTAAVQSTRFTSFSRSKSSTVELDTLDLDLYNDSARQIIRLFHMSSTGGRFKKITYIETDVNPLIPVRNKIEEYKEDTTDHPATDTLPNPLPTYNADFSKTVRILGIGNSFTLDLFDQHFVPICQGEGLNVIVGYPYQGGTTIREHVNYYLADSKEYDYRKWVDGKLTKTGEKTRTLKNALEDEPWDLVLIQSRGASDTYAAASDGMPELMQIVRENVDTFQFCQHVTWADALCGDLMGCKTQDERTDSLLFWGARNYNRFGYDYLLPVGRAIQNARTTFLGDNLNRDCHHLNTAEGRYIAALTFYEILTGKSCIGTKYQPTGMTAYRAEVCQHAAHNAILSPLKTTDMSKEYGVEKGVDPLKSITVDGVKYSGAFTTVYADVANTQTTIELECGKDTSVVVATPKQGRYSPITISLIGDDGATYAHTIKLLGAAFTRYMWNAISSTSDVSPTQDSICTQKILARGECSLQAFSKGGNAGTGATSGYYIAANSESAPKSYTKLSVPGNCKGILNVVARLGTKLGSAVPPYPFYAYIQNADKADPTTLYSTVTIGDAENLAFYPSLDNYDPLVMDGLYCDFSDKPAQHIYIYHTGNAQRYRSVEFIILDDTSKEPQGNKLSLSTDLNNLSASTEYKAMVCAHRGNSYAGKLANMPQSSIAELKKCIELGIDMVEVDGRYTKDKVVVNMHDETIDAFSTGTGKLADMNYEDVKKAYLINRDGTASSEPIHTFKEMLEAAKDSVYIVVDIKETACCVDMADIANSLGMMDQVMWYFANAQKDGANAIKNKYSKAILMPYSSTKDFLVTLHGRYNPLYIFHTALDKLEGDATFMPQVQKYSMVSYANMLNTPDEDMLKGDTTYMARMRAQDIRFIQSDYGEKVLEWLKKNDQHYVPSSKPTVIEESTADSTSRENIRKWLYNGQLLLLRDGKVYNLQGIEIY